MQIYYRSIPDKRPLPRKRPCTEFHGVNVAASIQMYANYILGKCLYGPNSRVMLKHPWMLTRDTTVCTYTYAHSTLSLDYNIVTEIALPSDYSS